MSSENRKPEATDSANANENAPSPFDAAADQVDQQDLIAAIFAGTFDENIREHAENLAEKLIQRQQELDRREGQLNLRAAEIENQLRQLRLQEKAQVEYRKLYEATLVTASEDLAIADDDDQDTEELISGIDLIETVANEDTAERESAESTEPVSSDAQKELLYHRIDKYIGAQRVPYSRLNTRMKKYGIKSNLHRQDTTVAEPFASELQENGRIESISNESRSADPVVLSMNRLTHSATVIRRRSEEVEQMYDRLTLIFSETLRQQGSLRKLIDSMPSRMQGISTAGVMNARKDLDRLTIQLTQVGRDHFLLPVELEDAA